MAELKKVRRLDNIKGKQKNVDNVEGVDNKAYSNYGEPVTTKKAPKDFQNSEKSLKSEKKSSKKMQTAILSGLQYKVDDNPPWITTILLGFQHYLMLLSSNLATPGLMASIICAVGIPDENHVKTMLLGNMIFACGICTLMQTFFGARHKGFYFFCLNCLLIQLGFYVASFFIGFKNVQRHNVLTLEIVLLVAQDYMVLVSTLACVK